MKNYTKPVANVNSFMVENVIAASGVTTPAEKLNIIKGANLGSVNNLFNK